MIRCSFPARRLATAAGLILILWLVACSSTGPGARTDDSEAARRLYNHLEQEYLLHRDAEVLQLGATFQADYPGHDLADAVSARMIASAIRLPDLDLALDLALAFPDRFPASVRRDQALTSAAQGLAAADRGDDGVRVLARLADDQSGAALAATETAAVTVARDLEPADLAILIDEFAVRSLRPVLVPLLDEAVAGASPEQVVHGGRIGVLGPLTGRYARFGNAFQAGVNQALAAEDPARTGPWEIVLEDTKGDPVVAALAARRLCGEEGCELIIGALLSATTATAALVTGQYGVPLVSPTATNESLGQLGSNVLQTNLTGRLEAEILAKLASEVLLKRRFAIIRPDTPEGANLASAFINALADRDAEVVIESVFDPAATDFRTQVLAVRETRPEVVFAPTTVDQMVLLGPQLDFYKVGALVLGPSEWNSSRLMQRAGSVMERAVFPVSEVVYPAQWSADFMASWPGAQYDEESTKLARSAYLAMRLSLQTMRAVAVADTVSLTEALAERLSSRVVEVAGPEGYGAVVRLVEGGEARTFPGHLYNEAWWRQLAADSLAVADSLAMADSLGLSDVELDTVETGGFGY